VSHSSSPVTKESIATELRTAIKHLLAARRELKKGGFTDDDDTEWGLKKKSGSYASMQGLRTIAGVLIAIGDSETAGLVRPDLKSLLDEWFGVMASSGKTASVPDAFCGYEPYEQNAALIVKTTTRKTWTDSVSWALSTAVAWNYLFTNHEALVGKVSDALREQTRDMLGAAARELLALQLSDGGWSWGDSSVCKASHLYFTWTAAQALADMYDYIFGDSAKQIGVERDNKTWTALQQRGLSESALRDAAAKAAAFLDARYVDAAISGSLTYELFTSDGLTLNKPDPDAHQIPLLYYYSYLLEALILTSFDNSSEGNAKRVDALRDVLDKRFREVLAIDEQADAAAVLTAESSTMSLTLYRAGTKPMLVPMRDPSLWGQLLRTAVLYAYYVNWTNVPDPLVLGASGAYWRVIADRWNKAGTIGEGLWDKVAFNLSVTCRAMESLVDVYDYVARLEREESKLTSELPASSQLAEVLAAAVLPYIQEQLRGRSTTEGSPAGDSEAVTSQESGGVSAKQDLPAIRKAIKDSLTPLLKPALIKVRDAAEARLPAIVATRSVQVKDPVLEMTLGKDAKGFEKDDLALTLASVITNLTFCTVVHCLSAILEEVAVGTLDGKAFEAYYASGKIREDPLSARIDRLITESMTVEFHRRDDRDRASAETVVNAFLRLTDDKTTKGRA
jgi:hypothetical protein